MSYLNKNKKKILFVTLLLFLFLLSFFLTKRFISLKILLLLPISLLTGIGLVVLFKNILPIKNILNYICFAIFLSLFLNTCLIFFYGCLGGRLDEMFFLVYIGLSAVLNITVFMIKEEDIFLSRLIKNVKFEIVDCLFISLFIVFFAILFSIGFENYFPNWDSFNFWAVDAKYIYENSAFRTSNFDLLKHAYLSFYSLQLNYVYLLYNGIFEQFSGLLSLFYAFLGVTTIIGYNLTVKGTPFKKTLIYLTIFAGVYSLYITQGIIFTQYSEVFCAIIILFYGLVLFKKSYLPQDFYKRLLLIFLLSLSLLFVKHSYFTLTLGLLFFFVIYEFVFNKNNFKLKLGTPKFWMTLAVLTVFSYVVYSYRDQFMSEENIVDLAVSGIDKFFTLKRFFYLFEIFKFLFTHIYLFLCCYLCVMAISFYSMELFNSKKRFLYSILPLYILSFPLAFYILRMWGFADMSLLRYVSIVFFLIPIVFIKIMPQFQTKSKPQIFFSVMIVFMIMFSFIVKVAAENHVDFEFTPVTGRYRDHIGHKYFADLGDRVLEIVSKDSRIMIVDMSSDKTRIGNMDLPAISVRYFLSNNSVGGQYFFDINNWMGHFIEVSPDYLLILSYDGYWVNCNNVLEEGNTYLVKINNQVVEEEGCFFIKEDVIEL